MDTTTSLVERYELDKLRQTELDSLRQAELEEARLIQSAMQPEDSLCAGPVTISHEFQPVDNVGGDFLDYFQLSDGCCGLYLGDVSGKGLAAAMYAALAVGTLRGVHKTGQSPGAVLTLLNKRLLLRSAPRRHTAIQYAVFNPKTREMQIASAGMPGPLHLSNKGCKVLELCGIPPGLLPEASYESSTLILEPGDSVVFFSDGITDTFDTRGETFGLDRLVALFADQREGSPEPMLQKVFSSLGRFCSGREQHDDMTAVLFHYRP